MGEGQRPGDGRGRHHQEVGGSHFGSAQERALTHAKAVLLVHHHQARVLQTQMFRQQRLGAHEEVGVPGRRGVGGGPTLRRRAGSCAEMYAKAIAQETGQGSVVLLGQQFGGGHECGRQTVTQTLQQGGQRDGGLAGPNITLQEPVHGNGSLEVLTDVTNGTRLGSR